MKKHLVLFLLPVLLFLSGIGVAIAEKPDYAKQVHKHCGTEKEKPSHNCEPVVTTTTEPPVTTTEPPVTTTEPPVTTTEPPVTSTTEPPPTTTEPPVTTTEPPVTTTEPPPTTTEPPVNTGDFYVSASGSDANPGTSEEPFATVNHAISQVPIEGGKSIIVGPGTYNEEVDFDEDYVQRVTLTSAVPYQATLTGTTALRVTGANVTVQGFEIAGVPGNTYGLVYIRKGHNAKLVNNIIRDSYGNDSIRVLWSNDVEIVGNSLYNSGEHVIDVNGGSQRTIIDSNIFFADYAASGRSVPSIAQSFIVVKYSGGDQTTGGTRIRNNVFTHYEGNKGFVVIGADGELRHEAIDIIISGNLFHNVGPEADKPVEIVDAKDVIVTGNVFHGDDGGDPFAGWVGTRDGSPNSENIAFNYNVFSSPGGTMQTVIESPSDLVTNGSMYGNTFWNGGNSVPQRFGDVFNWNQDPAVSLDDPGLPVNPVVLPVWDGTQFGGGYNSISAALSGYRALHG